MPQRHARKRRLPASFCLARDLLLGSRVEPRARDPCKIHWGLLPCSLLAGPRTMAFPVASAVLKGKARAGTVLSSLHDARQGLSLLSHARDRATVPCLPRTPATSSFFRTLPAASAATPSTAASSPSAPSSLTSSSTSTPFSDSNTLALLHSQPIHYVVASIVGRTLLLHPRDLVTLPRLNDVQLGDVLELDRIHEVGSRDYTLRAQHPVSPRAHTSSLPASSAQVPTPLVESKSWAARLRPNGLGHVGAVLDPSKVRVRCTVVEHTKGRMEFIVKKKRRKGYKKTIRHKQPYTRLRVDAIQLGKGD